MGDRMKTELGYFLLCYALNVLVLMGLLALTSWVGDLGIGWASLLVIPSILSAFTTSASLVTFGVWMRVEGVLFITKDCIHEDEKD